MSNELTKLIPKEAVILNVVRVVEYLTPDGHIEKVDLSYASDGNDLDVGKSLELIEWARAFTLSSMYMEMIHEFISEPDDEED